MPTLNSNLMIASTLSPLLALVAAVLFYMRHRSRVEPERRVPGLAYFAAVIICGGLGGIAGVAFGIQRACSGPDPGNLCGLWGFLVTGPLAMALVIFLVGCSLVLVRPSPKR